MPRPAHHAAARSRASSSVTSVTSIRPGVFNELVQLNQWGPYSYSRDELVDMLDAALAGDVVTE